MKKNIKTVIGLIIAFVIGISTTVGAATVFNSKDITYSSSATSKTNVKDSLDELYTKVGNSGGCSEGNLCRDALIKNVQLGDYISMTPTSTSYTISKSLTGYTSDQTINPSELNLWRVISKNSDGTVDVVSEYVSSNEINFDGKTGYINFVGVLNTIAAQYTNNKYVESTRHIGYNGQKETCTGTLSATTCPTDTGYEADINTVQNILGILSSKMPSGEASGYWLASRIVTDKNFGVRSVGYRTSLVNNTTSIKDLTLYTSDSSVTRVSLTPYKNIRPILTLRDNIQITDGDGKSAVTAYQLS